MEPIIIETRVDENDVYQFYRESNAKSFRTNLIFWLLLLAVFTVWGIVSWKNSGYLDYIPLFAFMCALGGLVGLLLVPQRQKKQAKAVIEQRGVNEKRMTFYEDRLTEDYTEKHETGHIETDYSGIVRVVEKPKDIIIFLGGGSSFIIRREDVSEEKLSKLRNLLRSKLPESAYEIKNK